MLIFMRNFEQSKQGHRWRQMILIAAALLGLLSIAAAIATAGSSMAHAAAKSIPLSAEDKANLDEASAYIESIGNLQGRFMQLDSDGSLTEGKFYLRRPGRLRFEYEPPSDLLVVADGTWVIVKDGFSSAQRYPIGSTPLGLLLRKDVDLSKNADVRKIIRKDGILAITLADTSGEAPGELTLVFDSPSLSLRQWIVTDAQGLQTRVALKDVQSGIQADNSLFVVKSNPKPDIGKR